MQQLHCSKCAMGISSFTR